jgi:predicted MFS family arabinose efflux permease
MSRWLVLLMAVASGAAVANLCYAQPLLSIMARDLACEESLVAYVPGLTLTGYAFGMLLFGPLGDLFERRKLIVTMLATTGVVCVAVALSPNITFLWVASLLLGFVTISAQLLIPFAAHLAPHASRGRVVGTVMSGLLIGLLLARTASGSIGAVLGWRAIYWLAAGLMLVFAAVMWRTLPGCKPQRVITYPHLIRSIFVLAREHPIIGRSALIGGMSNGVINAFWATLVFLLEKPPYGYGSFVAGMFGLVGVVGASIAPLTGILADKRGPNIALGLGLCTTTTSLVILILFGHFLAGLIIGIILIDLGLQATQISNQARIYSLPTAIHSRVNTIYMGGYAFGGGVGGFLGALGWKMAQWDGVCGFCFLMIGISLAIFAWEQTFRPRAATLPHGLPQVSDQA